MGNRILTLVALTAFGVAGVGLVWSVALSQPEPEPAPPIITEPAEPGPLVPIADPLAPPVAPVPAVDVPAVPGVDAVEAEPLPEFPAVGPWRISDEADLMQREAKLARTKASIEREVARLEALEKRIDLRWEEARRLHEEATARWQQTAADVATARGPMPAPSTLAERQAWLAMVVDVAKKMKSKQAAEMVALWPPALQVDVMARLGARRASPILAAMPAPASATITQRLAAAGPPTPMASAEGDEEAP